jgi:uncharacterized protein YraI
MSIKRSLPLMAVVAAGALALPAAATAGPVYKTAADDATPLVMHAGPNTGSPRVGAVPAGASVEVLCQTSGQSLSDPKYGRTSLWDRVSYGGAVGFVTDLYVLTNVDRIPGVPDCNASPAPAPAPAPPPPDPTPAPAKSVPGGPITRAEVLARSATWIQRRVMYSQSRYTDGYRQDCSGYVSFAWHLTSSPNSTALRSSRYTTPIPKSALQPGDMLGKPGHVALFVRWAGPGRPVVREEFDVGNPAVERTWSSGYAARFTAYRYRGIR